VLLIWLYVLAIAILIGAALNAAIEELWPRRELTEARARVNEAKEAERLHGRVGAKRPGLDTGEIDLPPNRSPGTAALGENSLARLDEPR
jgi:membrane protein